MKCIIFYLEYCRFIVATVALLYVQNEIFLLCIRLIETTENGKLEDEYYYKTIGPM